MKWIDTLELMALLKRFPNEQIEATAHLSERETSAYLWKYSAKGKCFQQSIGTKTKLYSRAEMLRFYRHQRWKIKSSFFLRDNHEKEMAIQLVEELGILCQLEGIITEKELDDIRICEHCHHLMDEGWLVDDCRTFCSDDCLEAVFPNINHSRTAENSLEENHSAYWTKWED